MGLNGGYGERMVGGRPLASQWKIERGVWTK